ncbi:MAG: hypothetical protein K0R69_3310, partial [Clostridia bacterium]|nr:hypothetical protein [Clostridia bacterium]
FAEATAEYLTAIRAAGMRKEMERLIEGE